MSLQPDEIVYMGNSILIGYSRVRYCDGKNYVDAHLIGKDAHYMKKDMKIRLMGFKTKKEAQDSILPKIREWIRHTRTDDYYVQAKMTR